MLPCRENEERVENRPGTFWLSCEIGWEQWGGWCEPEQSTFFLALQQMLAAVSFLMSTLCAQLQGKSSKSLKLIDTSGMQNWNTMSLMLLKRIAELYVAIAGGTRKIWMHYESVDQKHWGLLQPFSSMPASDWLKRSEITYFPLVLVIKHYPASQDGAVLLLAIRMFSNGRMSTLCSEIPAVCCSVTSRLQNRGVWMWCETVSVQRQTPLLRGEKDCCLPVAAARGMDHPHTNSGCSWTSIWDKGIYRLSGHVLFMLTLHL